MSLNISQAVRAVLNYLYKMKKDYSYDSVSLDMLRNALYDQRSVLEPAIDLLVGEGLLDFLTKKGEPIYRITDRGVNWILTYLTSIVRDAS